MSEHPRLSSTQQQMIDVLRLHAYRWLYFNHESKARTLLRGLVSRCPDDVETMLLLAWSELRLGNVDIATRQLDSLKFKRESENRIGHFLRGLIALRKRQPEQALSWLRLAGYAPQASEKESARDGHREDALASTPAPAGIP